MHFKLSNQKNFLTLMLVRFISLTGSQMQDFALSLYVFKKTGSATLFSSVIIAGFIPELLLTPISGVFADWVDRKKIIVFIDMLSGLVTVFFTVIYLVIGELPLLSIYVFVFILSLASAIYRPTISTIIPMIIKKEDLVAANGINSIIANLGNVLAPLIAGILFGFYGLVIIMVLNAISFILASVGELCINIPKVNSRPQKISFKTFYVDFSEGIKFINDKKIILKIIIIAPILNFVLNPLLSIGVTYVCQTIFKVSDFQYGFIQMASVFSMIIAPFFVSKYVKKHTLGKILFGNILTCSVLIGLMAIPSTSLYLNLFKSNLIPYVSFTIVVFLIGGFIATSNIALSSMFQKIVPIHMLGRVSAVMSTGCTACIPLGQIFFATLFDNVSAWICILIGSLILFVTISIFKKSLLSSTEHEPDKMKT